MLGMMRGYIRAIDAFNRRLGRVAMYGIFALMAVLLYSTLSKAVSLPALWTLEMAQFTMVAYYILGGPYAIQMGSNVRMDLLYGDWSPRRKAWFDAVTIGFLIFYLCVLLYGGLASLAYSVGYFGTEPITFLSGLVIGASETAFMERSSSPWRPYMWPIKLLMVAGMFLMLLQCLSEFFKDILRLQGDDIPAETA
ncbi:TRAP transporter small permease subunit [Jannaschia sp.]|nr:TRAP transporter small permease subunit [Jannaschia sp.]